MKTETKASIIAFSVALSERLSYGSVVFKLFRGFLGEIIFEEHCFLTNVTVHNIYRSCLYYSLAKQTNRLVLSDTM